MANKLYSDGYLAWFDKVGAARPHHTDHLSVDDIEKTIKKLVPHSWRLEGNQLIAQTDMGELTQRIPTDYICVGEDANGLPKLQKVVL